MSTAAHSGLNNHAQRKLAEALRDPQYNPVVILGHGQIAMMQVQECQRRHIPVIVIGDGSYAIQSLHSPAEQALGQDDYYINLGEDYLGRPSELDQLIEKLKITRSAVTAEFENVPVELLELFEKQRVRLAPGSKAFAICRDKLKEKQHFQAHSIPHTEFLELQAGD